ncbi:hypothetical protein VNO80_10788 [Phaseolus coccineus]|uniref:EKN n=1 Tax=Phaseolus coccineus TaxID=3886 RepID=A0AAN9NE18_PHACN
MGNCGSNPKTDEGPLDMPEPVTEDIKVQQKENEPNIETNKEETLNDSDNKSLRNLLDEKVDEEPKIEEVKAEAKAEEPKTEVVKVEEEKSKAEEEAKIEA